MDMKCTVHDLNIICLNLGRVKFQRYGASVSCTLTKNINSQQLKTNGKLLTFKDLKTKTDKTCSLIIIK